MSFCHFNRDTEYNINHVSSVTRQWFCNEKDSNRQIRKDKKAKETENISRGMFLYLFFLSVAITVISIYTASLTCLNSTGNNPTELVLPEEINTVSESYDQFTLGCALI